MTRKLALVVLLLFTGCASSYQPPRSAPSWAYRGVTKADNSTVLSYFPSLDACRTTRSTEVVKPADWTPAGLSEECLPVTITPGSGDTGWSAFSFPAFSGLGAALSGPPANCERIRQIVALVYRVSMCAPVLVREGAPKSPWVCQDGTRKCPPEERTRLLME